MNDLACIYCGCTEDQGCPIPPASCWWASLDPPVCSGCTEIAAQLDELIKNHRPPPFPGWAVLNWLCLDKDGPRVLLDRWERLARAETVKAQAREARRRRRKTPTRPAPATPRKPSFRVSHTTPRRTSRVKRQPGGRR